jgi:hypothetical protein
MARTECGYYFRIKKYGHADHYTAAMMPKILAKIGSP